MLTTPYEWSVFRYVPDGGAGEQLNIGVVLRGTRSGRLLAQIDPHYRRLTAAFPRMDGDHFRRFAQALQLQLNDRSAPGLFSADYGLTDLLTELLPDRDLAIQWSDPLPGLTDDLGKELQALFHRMVGSNLPASGRERRDDAAVFNTFADALPPEHRTDIQRRVTFTVSEQRYEFDHSIRNGREHVIEPLSLDYLDSGDIRRRVTEKLGELVALRSEEELGSVWYLLGKPSRADHERQYSGAVRLLRDQSDKLPRPQRNGDQWVRVFEETQLAEFCASVERELRHEPPPR